VLAANGVEELLAVDLGRRLIVQYRDTLVRHAVSLPMYVNDLTLRPTANGRSPTAATSPKLHGPAQRPLPD
jgi:hypothetical protein